MLKRIAFVTVVCTCVSVAFGAAVKITDFIPLDPESATADGMAILNYVSGQDKTVVQVVISGFTPGTTYEVVFQSGTHSTRASSSIFTDANGHGTLHTTLNPDPRFPSEGGDWSNSDVLIGFNLTDGDADNDQLRAIGANPGS